MKQISWKAILPHIIAVGIFLVIAAFYCKPALEGKVVNQQDLAHWHGMAQSSFKYKETHGHFPLWVNSMFGGMPGYQIAMDADNSVSLAYLHGVFTLFLPAPISYFFLLCISFYFLSQVLRINPWLGILGAIAYAYSTYDPIIIMVGHVTKVQAMGYMPAMLAAIFLVFQKRYWIGAALTVVFSALLVAQNHLQISYYFAFIALFAGVVYAVHWIKQKDYKHLITSAVILVVAGTVGVLVNIVTLATTLDFSKATMRGGTLALESAGKATQTSGLDIDYAFMWSYGKAETFTLIVPDIYGAASSGQLDGSSHVAKAMEEKGVPEDQAAQIAAYSSSYWGAQTQGTSGPVYLGAVICLLFIFGLIYVKSIDKWWIAAICLFAILLSWGKNFEAFNSFIFNHVPLYNKFRVPTLTLVIPQFLFPLLGILALQKFFFEEKDKANAFKAVKTTGIATGVVAALLILFYLTSDYVGIGDAQVKGLYDQVSQGNKDFSKILYNALLQDRKSMFGADLLRSLIFIALAFAALWAAVKNKLKKEYALIALLLLSSIDLLAVGRRYLNNDTFQEPAEYDETYFKPTAADQQILRDTSFYRVLNLTQDVFNDALTSYHHNSVGGYSPVKLAIAQDLLTYQFGKGTLNRSVLNMLNTKYVIQPGPQNQPQVYTNSDALGNAWLVKTVQYVKGPGEAMKAIDNFTPKDTAVVEEQFKSSIPFSPEADSAASIKLIKNDNDIATYQFQSKTNQFAVFSEIYYDRGWKAYIDDKETPIVNTDYALRGLAIPKGTHNIKFEFRPASYYSSVKIAVVASAIGWILILVSVVLAFRKRKKIAKLV